MNKNFKIITINGIRGIITLIFVGLGLIAGFIISPGWVCMSLWNYLMKDSVNIAQMNLYQGIMLWAIIALSLYALNNKKALIGIGSYPTLSQEQIKDIILKSKYSENFPVKDIDLTPTEIKIQDDTEKEVKSEMEESEEIRK